ncbi:N-acetyltransferase [Spirochaetia bacterium]|nr:N-acetyltransferase [Spirochaetia bacterium]
MNNFDVVIRVMIIDDYEQVHRLWTGTAGMGMRNLDDGEEGIRKFLERNPNTCFVAEIEGKLAGVILSGHDGRRAYIYHTAVKEKYRGQGIGRALLDAVENAMQKEGINKIALVAFNTNEKGNRFWEKQGYADRHDLVYRNKSINPENV